MFSHFDQNNNGLLEAVELDEIAKNDNLDKLSRKCKLSDMLKFDDADHDGHLNINEFYDAYSKLYSVSVISLDKALEINQVTTHVGDNVEIKCDITGTPAPPIVWRRNDIDLSTIPQDDIKVFIDGSLYLTNIQVIHAGNFTCHAQRNKDVVQTHILKVHTVPKVKVLPKLQYRAPSEMASMMCHVVGEPTPTVKWLKNDDKLKMASHKYTIIGNGTSLTVGKITYSDTGAYSCVADNAAGSASDISSIVVEDEPQPTVLAEERRFFVFHDWGVSVYDGEDCRLYHQIQSTDIIPGTQEYVCGDRGVNCSWGQAINVADRYVYVSQPRLHRVLIISKIQMVVVDVVSTDKYPVGLSYVSYNDQVWVICWRNFENKGSKTIEVIRNASQKRKHHSVHPQPIDGHFDLVNDLFVPPMQDLGHRFRHAYVVHKNQRGMFKIDMAAMKYTKSVDLTPYNCVPKNLVYSSLRGYVIIQCEEPVTKRPSGQLLVDYMTDSVLAHKLDLFGKPFISPDSRYVVTLETNNSSFVITCQEVTEAGLRFKFDVKTTLDISDITFFPSLTTHSYDIYASSTNKVDVLFIDLSNGKVEMITEVGQPLNPSLTEWENPNRPIDAGATFFGTYMVTPAGNALFVLNGRTRTVNCEIGNIIHPRLVVWLKVP
ncbi:Follistatin-related protein 5 [Nymphon striatum]|nr:Follistatin-related protein 5 [Nymphon striatum]